MADETATTETPRPTVQTPSVSRFIMIFLFLLALWTMFDPGLSAGFAVAANVVFAPVIGFGGGFPVLTILLAGLLTTTISSVLRHYFTDWVRQARTQKWLRAWQRERLDAVRKGNKAKLEKLQDMYRGSQKELMDLQFAPMKSMALTWFMFIVVFNWVRVFVEQSLAQLGNHWIAVPWSSNTLLTDVYVFPSWLLLYSLLAIPFGQIVARVLKFVSFRRKLQDMGLSLHPGAGDAA